MLAQGKLPKERIKRTKEILLDSIRHELERQAKTLAFRLISQINIISSVGVSTIIRSNEAVSEDIKAIGLDRPYIDDVTKQDFENIHLILAKDKKFIKFSKNLGREYQQAFTNLVESAK